ncbi:MAG: hypothetical protein ACTHJ5_13700 [Ilyomonas sp.]
MPSQRFHDFMDNKISREKLKLSTVIEIIGKYEKNPSNFLSSLRRGDRGVTVEEILKCQDHFGLNPCDLFEKKKPDYDKPEEGLVTTMASEPSSDLIQIIKSQQETIRSQQETIKYLTGNGNGRPAVG